MDTLNKIIGNRELARKALSGLVISNKSSKPTNVSVWNNDFFDLCNDRKWCRYSLQLISTPRDMRFAIILQEMIKCPGCRHASGPLTANSCSLTGVLDLRFSKFCHTAVQKGISRLAQAQNNVDFIYVEVFSYWH
jgi:hypothetical protein